MSAKSRPSAFSWRKGAGLLITVHLLLSQNQGLINAQVINNRTCQLYFSSFSVVISNYKLVKPPLVENEGYSLTNISLAKCASRCSHYLGGPKKLKCKSINYNAESQLCELLRIEYFTVVKNNTGKYNTSLEATQGWTHYSPDPSNRFVSIFLLPVETNAINQPCTYTTLFQHVYTTSVTLKRRCMNVKMTFCVYWVGLTLFQRLYHVRNVETTSYERWNDVGYVDYFKNLRMTATTLQMRVKINK